MDALTKALQVTTGSGQYLIPEDLNPVIMEYLGRLNPLWALMPKKQGEGKTHEYVKRTAVPTAWFEGEITTPSYNASTYTRESVQLKILRTSGGVSGFLQATSSRFTNALRSEIVGSLEGLSQALEWAFLYGNKKDAYQFDGLFAFMEADATAKKAISAGGNTLDVDAVITLADLDTMVDSVSLHRLSASDQYIWMMSPQMISKVTGLQTRISRIVPNLEFEGGFRFSSYRDIPIVPTPYLRPASVTTSPAGAAAAAAGGSLVADEYFYMIASVTDAGEQIAGTEFSGTTATTNLTLDITWTADATAKAYRIYRGTTTGVDNLGLLTTIAAKGYDAEGAVTSNVAAWSDDGTFGTPNTEVNPLAAGEESIALINLNEERGLTAIGMLSPLGDPTESFFSYVPLATRKSAYEYMIEGFLACVVAYPQVHAVARRAKLA